MIFGLEAEVGGCAVGMGMGRGRELGGKRGRSLFASHDPLFFLDGGLNKSI